MKLADLQAHATSLRLEPLDAPLSPQALNQVVMVIGIGSDLVNIKRIERLYERYGNHFLSRVFTETEIAYAFKHKQPFASLAARFAAKEAASKAFGTGIGAQLGWKSVSVRSLSSGQPIIDLDSKGHLLMDQKKATQILLSLSHTRNLAQAFVVIA